MDKKLSEFRPLLINNQIILNSIEQNDKEGTPESAGRNEELLSALDQSFSGIIDKYKQLSKSLIQVEEDKGMEKQAEKRVERKRR